MATAKTCFLIGPMRGDVQMERQRRLAEIVKEALGELQHDEFDVRTPVIHEGGDIVQQVIGALYRADIVIADLTRNNPSVLYELALRHCMGLPCIHVVDKNSAQDGESANLARAALQAQLAAVNENDHDGARLKRALTLLDDLARPLAFDVAQERYVVVDFDEGAAGNNDFVAMLNATIKSSKPIMNPVTSYFDGRALTDVSPTSGLALGYFLNFVVRTAASIVNKRPTKVMFSGELEGNRREAEYLLEKELDEAKLAIWIPDRVKFARPDYIAKLKKGGQFHDAILVQDATGYRDISLLICRKVLLFADIPTTLRVVNSSIEWRSASERLRPEQKEEKKELVSREFIRFLGALEHWKAAYVADEWQRERPDEELIRFLRDRVTIEPLPQEWRVEG